MNRIFLDDAGGAPILPEVVAALRDLPAGNPSSPHAEGRAARAAIDRARDTAAQALGADRTEVTFTSSGTEAVNLAFQIAEKLPAEKRNDDPLQFATHPDFVTFPPDGPLRQISIPQTRLLKERAQFLPHKGARRVFLIDHADHRQAVRLGAMGLVLKEKAADMLLQAIEKVHAGEVWLESTMIADVLGALTGTRASQPPDPEAAKIAALTERERDTEHVGRDRAA